MPARSRPISRSVAMICIAAAIATLGAPPPHRISAAEPVGAAGAVPKPLGLRLPTDNDALFTGDGPGFYMFVDRTFEGRKSSPWEGGRYGYVRNPERSGGGLVYTRFHEGIDIRPVRRDRTGEPLDTVHSIADGRIVYTAADAGKSSYGRYVVVLHDWGDGPFYSLYAHLASIAVTPGTTVRAGAELGRLGYTGAGIDRRRAHLHLELNLLLNARFEDWHRLAYADPNHHGIHNGLNLAGIDIAGLFLEHRRNPAITMSAFISRMEPYFKVTARHTRGLDLPRRYPWMVRGRLAAAPSVTVTFSRSGVPLSIEPSDRRVDAPVVTWVRHSPSHHSWNTRGRLTGSGNSAALSDPGRLYMRLVTGDF